MRHVVLRVAAAMGWTAVVVASLWAPAQPEFLPTGGSCQVALCGTLENPARWQAAAVLWGVGAVVAVLASMLLAPARRRPRLTHVVLGALASPFLLALVLIVAFVVSWSTSALGAWSVLLVAATLLLTHGVGWGRAGRTPVGRVETPTHVA